jgi:hypothetical protein
MTDPAGPIPITAIVDDVANLADLRARHLKLQADICGLAGRIRVAEMVTEVVDGVPIRVVDERGGDVTVSLVTSTADRRTAEVVRDRRFEDSFGLLLSDEQVHRDNVGWNFSRGGALRLARAWVIEGRRP